MSITRVQAADVTPTPPHPAAPPPAQVDLRDYQLAAVESLTTPGQHNWLVVAPTGSGKTEIMVHVARCGAVRCTQA